MKRILGTAIALALAAPMFAYAADGYVVGDISLQSGPDTEYPPIENLAGGTEVDVQGCIEGFSWCDVIVGDDRGWVPGSYIEEEYDNQPVFLVDYGPRIGIPVVSFSIGVYWDAHYRNRPFYSQRTEWVNRRIEVRSPPRPSMAKAPPIPHGGGHPAPPGGHAPPPQRAVTNNAPHTEQRPEARPTPPAQETRTTETVNHRTTTTTTDHSTVQHAPATEHPTTAAAAATPPKPAVHAAPPPKPHEEAKPAPKEEPKPPEHKDDDHGGH